MFSIIRTTWPRFKRRLNPTPPFSTVTGSFIFLCIATMRRKKKPFVAPMGVRPELVGKNMWSLRTPNGRLLFYELSELAERYGEGWLEYDWLNPFTKKIQTKRSYVKKIVLKDGRKAWVGCGFWKES